MTTQASPIPPWSEMDLGTRIRVLAALRNVNCSEVAKAAGLSPATVLKIAKGGTPTLDTARRLVIAFEFERVEDLIP